MSNKITKGGFFGLNETDRNSGFLVFLAFIATFVIVVFVSQTSKY
jgi:hypothetical protein